MPRWTTHSTQRTVLAIAHNVTAATRLFDVVGLVAEDNRIQLEFTITGSSAFTAGTDELLRAEGITPLPWDSALDRTFDLAISASHGGKLELVDAPLLIVPHGVGYNKYLPRFPIPDSRFPIPDSRFPIPDSRFPVFGLDEQWLCHDGELIPTTLVLSHHEQLDRLAVSCPVAVPAALVAGDPCYDRMLASTALRAWYRRGLGVGERRLVVLSSTWGEGSLQSEWPDLAVEVAAALPIDEYRVVAALHPNVWHGHGEWQVRQWCRAAERAGVTLLPPREGWRAALLAADLVIGDHGSATFYGAALGTPTLLATAPHHTVHPASAVGRFLRAAPRLVPGRYRDQIARAIAEPTDLTAVTALVSAAPGEAMARLRAACYRLLRLPEPAEPAPTPTVPAATTGDGEPAAQLVAVDLTADPPTITRHPARPPADTDRPPPAGSHLAVAAHGATRRLLDLAEIVVLDDPADTAPVLAATSGALLATAPAGAGTWLVRHTGGAVVHLHGAGRLGASLVHAWLVAGHAMTDLPATVRVRIGQRVVSVSRRTSLTNPPAR